MSGGKELGATFFFHIQKHRKLLPVLTYYDAFPRAYMCIIFLNVNIEIELVFWWMRIIHLRFMSRTHFFVMKQVEKLNSEKSVSYQWISYPF